MTVIKNRDNSFSVIPEEALKPGEYLLLFGYALYVRDPVFIVGQGFGLFVYLRNLYFIRRERRASSIA